MEQAFSAMKLTARAYHKIIRTARTIADLEGEEQIRTAHLREASGIPDSERKILGEVTEMERIDLQQDTLQKSLPLSDEEMEYEYWLAGIQGISSKKKYLLRECMKTGRAVYYIEETQLAGLDFLSEKERQALKSAGKQRIGNRRAEAA